MVILQSPKSKVIPDFCLMGDSVVALVGFNKISKGDVGTVAGPCDCDQTEPQKGLHAPEQRLGR